MHGTVKRNFVIFGGTGDLSYRKLLPAFFNLFIRNILGKYDRIFIIGRRPYSTEAYIESAQEWLQKFARFDTCSAHVQAFFTHVYYVQMDFTQLEAYEKLSTVLNAAACDTNIFYFAVAPKFFERITLGLASIPLREDTRIVLEKPFGETLERAEELSHSLEKHFGPQNIYRIDHYLGKEMVRSILSMRSTNPIFKHCWNKEAIQEVSIAALEEVGVGSRGGYYDEVGAMKDMLQNHLMQILSLVAMELPENITDIAAIQKNQEEVFAALRPLTQVDIASDVLLAQYDGYVNEGQISLHSLTETYAKCRIFIDNHRWHGVPFVLTTGKKLAQRYMEVAITFTPLGDAPSNVLIFEVQPREGVRLRFNSKKPGENAGIISVEMDFCQSCEVNFTSNTPEAYERLIDAVIQGDRAWFSTWKQIAASWHYVEGLKKAYHEQGLPVLSYAAGSTGPK